MHTWEEHPNATKNGPRSLNLGLRHKSASRAAPEPITESEPAPDPEFIPEPDLEPMSVLDADLVVQSDLVYEDVH